MHPDRYRARPLTPRQREYLRAVARLEPATMRELGAAVGNRPSTNAVRQALEALRRKGLVSWEPVKARTIQLTQRGWAVLERLAAHDAGGAFYPVKPCPTCGVVTALPSCLHCELVEAHRRVFGGDAREASRA